jgi:putative membrane protein
MPAAAAAWFSPQGQPSLAREACSEGGEMSEPTHAKDPLSEPNTLLASNRTDMALERTRMAADRTQMAVLRTALSLISFGFTIYQFLSKFAAPDHPRAAESARNFGEALILLGLAMLVIGVIGEFTTRIGLNARQRRLYALGLTAERPIWRPSPVQLMSLLLFALGAVAVWGVITRSGPLG